MSLTASLNIALSGISTSSDQLAVVSRNVARANEEGATRKNANVSTIESGASRVSSIVRLANPQLLAAVLKSNSDAGTQQVIANALNQFDLTVNDPSLEGSPSSLIGKLNQALQVYAASPQDVTAANAAVSAAKELAQGLNTASLSVQQQRSLADQAMAASVNNINSLLSQFQSLNEEIVRGSGSGQDVTDTLDQRDLIVQKLSKEIGIRTVTEGNKSMQIYSDQGVTLFNGVPREVTFKATAFLGPNTNGNAVYADGIPIVGGSGTMISTSGQLAGYAAVRDTLGVTYQNQLDEVARGLVEAFAETDPAGGALPAALGLFSWDGSPAMPTSGAVNRGLASSIVVNSAVDPSKGGNASLLRDGGINGASYVYNTNSSSAYSNRIEAIIDNINQSRTFDNAAGVANTGSISAFAGASAGWLQSQRQTATDESSYNNILQQRAMDALSKDTGVNIDEEMTNMLQFERAYQASARVMTTIDQMFQTLLDTYK
jgi:flagellar hook-associated protein 1 FlgK